MKVINISKLTCELKLTKIFFIAPLPQRNYLPPSTSYGTPDLGNLASSETPSQSYGDNKSTSYDLPASG